MWEDSVELGCKEQVCKQNDPADNRLLPDAEGREDSPDDIIGGDLSGKFSE